MFVQLKCVWHEKVLHCLSFILKQLKLTFFFVFYITASTEKVTKPRTKRTARMSTGGSSPRKQVPTKNESKGFHLYL